MPTTFRTSASGDVTMFDRDAQYLLKLMGHSGTVPSALAAEDVAGALDRLKRAVADEQRRADERASTDEPEEDDDEAEESVRLAHRAMPLIDLLTAAESSETYVKWFH